MVPIFQCSPKERRRISARCAGVIISPPPVDAGPPCRDQPPARPATDHTTGRIGRGRRNVKDVESGVPEDGGGRLIPHALPGAVGPLMVAVIEASFRTALMAGFGTLHRAPAGLGPAACRAVGVATVARRTDRKEAVAPAAGLLAKGLVHGVGGPGRPPTGRRNPNRGTTRPTGSVCRRARRSRGSGGPVRTLTFVCGPSVRYPKHRGNTTAGAMDAAAGVDAHDAPTPACKTTRRAVSHKRPQSILFVLIKNPEELRDRTDATIRVQTSSLSRGRRHR